MTDTTQNAKVVSIIEDGRSQIQQSLIVVTENGRQYRATGRAQKKYRIGDAVVIGHDEWDDRTWFVR